MKRSVVFVSALTAAAAAIRFTTLGGQSFWFDEAVTVQLVRKSLWGMLAALPGTESTPPLYYLLAWPWSRAFGTSEVGLRALSALLGTATVPVVYAAGRLLVSRRAGLFAACLTAFSPLLVWYSQEARSYALFVFLSALSFLAFGHALLRPTPRHLISWALVACLALATHYFAVFLIGGEALLLLLAHTRSRAVWAAVASAAAAGGALLPLALHQHNTGQTAWIAAGPVGGRLRQMLRQFLTGEYAPAHSTIAAVLVLILVAAGLAWLVEGRERRGALIALALGALAVFAPLALTVTQFDDFFYRNLIGAWIPLAIALASVFASRRAGRLGVVCLLAACALELASLTIVSRRTGLHRDDWRAATKALGSIDGQRAIITDPAYERVAIRLYRPSVRAMPRTGAKVREIVFLGLRPLPLRLHPPAGFQLVEQQRIQHVTLVRYRSNVARELTPPLLAARGDFDAGGVLLDSASATASWYPRG